LGLRIFSRKGVGGGYAAVELGECAGATCAALQFSAGSWPDRAGSLNRFGIFHEAATYRREETEEHAFAGFLTSSKEESIGEARQALRQVEGGVPVTVAWGQTRNGHTQSNVGHAQVAPSTTWTQSEEILTGLLHGVAADSSRDQAATHVPGFLAVMRNAGLSRTPVFQSPFLHNGKLYELRVKWKLGGRKGEPQELSGELRNERKQTTAEFRAFYAANDTSGVPVRFEYNPRSYLRLTFEADPAASSPIPDLVTG
jgi:hypothetical protein